jgi:hypothetical protein
MTINEKADESENATAEPAKSTEEPGPPKPEEQP